MDGSDVGISIGTGGAGTESTFQFFRAMVESGPQAANPMAFPSTVPNAPAGILGIELDLRGPNTTFAQRGNAAEAAIICGARWIRHGRAVTVLAGGVDEISEPFFHGHAVHGVLTPDRMRPYDVARSGYILGEGATLVVLESEESARSRGAPIYGEIAGWGQSTEVRDVLDYPPSADPLVRAIDRSLRMAGVRAAQIDWVNGSANGSRRLDTLELEAVRRLFAAGGSRRIPLSSVKPVFGESLGAGAVRLASTLIAMEQRFIPPTPGLEDPEEARGTDPVMGECRDVSRLDGVLQDGAADGGGCVALVLRRV
jgi:3-oxoacyl-(acyl-carrier-protein) synthase